MKKPLLLALVLALAASAHAQTIVTFNFFLGVLSDSGGTAVSDGSVVQFIVSPDSTFGAPTSSSFVSGNDVILATRAVDSSTGGAPGVVYVAISNIDLAAAGITGGSFIAVRWFPTLGIAAVQPGNSTPYGQWSYANDPSWVVPTSSGVTDFAFQTASAYGGPNPDTVGRTTQTTPAAIPEPSTYAALAGLAALGAAIWRKRRNHPSRQHLQNA